MHTETPAADQVPAEQSRQLETLVAATRVENVPAAQLVHDVELIDDHVPTLQFRQVDTDDAPTTLDHKPAVHEMQEVAEPSE